MHSCFANIDNLFFLSVRVHCHLDEMLSFFLCTGVTDSPQV